MTDDPWAAFRGPKQTSDDPWASFRAKPTEPQTPQEATDAMSVPDKFTRAGVKGLTTGASGLVNTLGKSIDGADPKKLAKLQQLIGAVEERMGVDASQYAPASGITGDSNRPLGERIANVPRSVVEMAGPAALGFAAGGLPGAIAATTATTAGPTIDRKREALGLSPDQELPTKAKYEVGTKLATDAVLLAAGGKLTQGLLAPVEQAGVRGLTETGKRALMATAADAGFGMDAAAVDKGLIDKQMPTLSDLAVGAAQGGLPGLVAHTPGIAGRLPSAAGESAAAAGRAIREPVVNRTFKPLESLEPESRGRAANRVEEFSGNMNATEKSLLKDVNTASSGLDGVTEEYIDKIKTAYDEGVPIKPEWLEAVNKADPIAGRAVTDLNTFGSMRDLENSALYKKVKDINPLTNFKSRITDYAIGHLFSPTLAKAIAAAETAVAGGAYGIDKFTGLSDPGKVITEKYAGTASPTQSVAEARQSSKAEQSRQFDFRKAADLDVARRELNLASAEEKALKFRKVADEHAASVEKQKKDELASNLKNQRYLLGVRKNSETSSSSDATLAMRVSRLNEKYRKETEAEEEKGVARQANLMRNSQSVEDTRLKTLAKAAEKVSKAKEKVREAEKDADPEMFVFEHRGMKTRIPKKRVSNPSGYKETFRKFTDRRLDLIDEAKDMTDDTTTHKYLDQMAKDWTDATNDPIQARKALDRILGDKNISDNVKKHLEDNWYRVAGTWETVER